MQSNVIYILQQYFVTVSSLTCLYVTDKAIHKDRIKFTKHCQKLMHGDVVAPGSWLGVIVGLIKAVDGVNAQQSALVIFVSEDFVCHSLVNII